jgi:hypothetical protein
MQQDGGWMHADEQQKRQVVENVSDVQKYPSLSRWRRSLKAGFTAAPAGSGGVARRNCQALVRQRGYQRLCREDEEFLVDGALMIKTYKTHPSLNILTAFPPITSSLPCSSAPNTPPTALSFVLTESHCPSSSSSGGKNG